MLNKNEAIYSSIRWPLSFDKELSEAFRYLVEIFEEEGIPANQYVLTTIGAMRWDWPADPLGIAFFWSKRYPTYFAVWRISEFGIISFASGSEEIREYIRNIKCR